MTNEIILNKIVALKSSTLFSRNNVENKELYRMLLLLEKSLVAIDNIPVKKGKKNVYDNLELIIECIDYNVVEENYQEINQEFIDKYPLILRFLRESGYYVIKKSPFMYLSRIGMILDLIIVIQIFVFDWKLIPLATVLFTIGKILKVFIAKKKNKLIVW